VRLSEMYQPFSVHVGIVASCGVLGTSSRGLKLYGCRRKNAMLDRVAKQAFADS
jgi:hypothetical protein